MDARNENAALAIVEDGMARTIARACLFVGLPLGRFHLIEKRVDHFAKRLRL